jgi:hypothetical protein
MELTEIFERFANPDLLETVHRYLGNQDHPQFASVLVPASVIARFEIR